MGHTGGSSALLRFPNVAVLTLLFIYYLLLLVLFWQYSDFSLFRRGGNGGNLMQGACGRPFLTAVVRQNILHVTCE